MKIAVTGGTGFIGWYILSKLLEEEHQLKAWYRDESRIDSNFASREDCEWLKGELGNAESTSKLVEGCDAVVHSALWKPGRSFRGGEGDVVEFSQRNIVGTLQLMEAAREAGVKRFVFISTCAVHERILDDRKLDEAHPLWPLSHYGAHKAAIEKFVHSFGFGQGFPICALRPTGVYGINRPVSNSKWFELVEAIVNNQPVNVKGGGKEVHAADVAGAVSVLLNSTDPEAIAGEAFNCYDRYVSQFEVAHIAKQLCNSESTINGVQTTPKNQIETEKLRQLGMTFGGDQLLEKTIGQMVESIKTAEASTI